MEVDKLKRKNKPPSLKATRVPSSTRISIQNELEPEQIAPSRVTASLANRAGEANRFAPAANRHFLPLFSADSAGGEFTFPQVML
jgi:hypothetical protein